MGTSTGRLQDPVAGRPGYQVMGRSGDGGTSVIHVFKIQLTNILNLLWLITQDSIVNVVQKNSVKRTSVIHAF